MQKTIIAVDFDNTISMVGYPDCGQPNMGLISVLQKAKAKGAILILWTCREGEKLQEAIDFCEEVGVPLDYANENTAEALKMFGADSRKIFANIYIDDRACLPEDAKAAIEKEMIL